MSLGGSQFNASLLRGGGGGGTGAATLGGAGSAFGSRPADIPMPNPFGDLSSLYPNLSGTNSQVSQNVLNELNGQLSPGTINNIRNNAASFGVSTGMPGSQFAGDSGLRQLGLQTEQLQDQGLQDYLAGITGISKTQTVDPALQTDVNTQNSIWNAAPDPAAAAAQQESLFDKYLKTLSSPAGGTGISSGGGGGNGAPWWAGGDALLGSLGPGTVKTGAGTYHTPYTAGGF